MAEVEEQIHAGQQFFVRGVIDLAINEVFDVQWTTPNIGEYANLTFNLECEGETAWYIYENVAISTPGTAITVFNHNRNHAKTSKAVLKSQYNTSTENADADTAVAGATLLMSGVVLAGKQGGVVSQDDEIILKQNEDYCFRGVATAAGQVNYYMSWYEK